MVYDENNDVQETWYVDIILKNIVTGQDLKARYNADQTVELFNRRMQLQELFYSWDEFKEANQYLIAYADAKAMYNGFEYIGNYFYGSSKMDSTVEGVIETFVKFSPFMKESHGTEPIETPDEPAEPPTVIGKDQIFGSDLINANADGSVTVTVQGGEIDGFNQTKKPYPISVYTRNANIDAGTKLQDYTVDYEVKLFNEPSSSSFMNIYIIREGKLFEHDRIDVMREDQIIYNYHRDDDRDSERFFSWDDLISVHGNKTIAHRYSETHLGVGTFAGNFIIRSTGSSGAVAGDEYTFTQYDIEYQGD
ncbi:hypothetical protein JCM19239_7059 [Vibrio variabilis]|uniref:Uncharacterized protein n=1 Tax=Vibrio variabilis TaxID=990271 RepID=A0ABQ0JM14_9VIBR|nr:hypothetical protein JCM19239_7059 [Vibrio variabilis]